MGKALSKSRAKMASTSHGSSSNPTQKYKFIADNYSNIQEVTNALRSSGLESSNLIIGIDFTKSNEWTGEQSFNGRSLHALTDSISNPYEQAIRIIGETLAPFDDDNLIPCFGFGDVSTGDHSVFSFSSNGEPCNGFEEVLSQYREIVLNVRLSGPTSFAPVMKASMNIVEESGGQYHVLLIIADGQVTRSVDNSSGSFSSQEQETMDAIVEASDYALSIVLVGVGDGPWDAMKQFDDGIAHRRFDNFQFVNFTSLMAKNLPKAQREAAFALAALMEIPIQYKATVELGMLTQKLGRRSTVKVLPTPSSMARFVGNKPAYIKDLRLGGNVNIPSYTRGSSSGDDGNSIEPSVTYAASDSHMCPVCLTRERDMAFGCGHQTCRSCSANLVACPLCRQTIVKRLRLYP